MRAQLSPDPLLAPRRGAASSFPFASPATAAVPSMWSRPRRPAPLRPASHWPGRRCLAYRCRSPSASSPRAWCTSCCRARRSTPAASRWPATRAPLPPPCALSKSQAASPCPATTWPCRSSSTPSTSATGGRTAQSSSTRTMRRRPSAPCSPSYLSASRRWMGGCRPFTRRSAPSPTSTSTALARSLPSSTTRAACGDVDVECPGLPRRARL